MQIAATDRGEADTDGPPRPQFGNLHFPDVAPSLVGTAARVKRGVIDPFGKPFHDVDDDKNDDDDRAGNLEVQSANRLKQPKSHTAGANDAQDG